MATLAQIVTGGFGGAFPPVTSQYVIKQYLSHNDAINGLEYLNNAVNDGQNGLMVKVKTDETRNEGATRAFGVDYTAANYSPSNKVLNLHPCGDAFIEDDAVGRATPAYREYSFAKATNNAINTFLKKLILGNETSVATEFNGLEAQLDSGMDLTADPINVFGLTMDKLIQVEDKFNQQLACMQGVPNVIITNAKTAAKLGTLNSMRYRLQSVINYSDRQYREYQNARILILDDACFSSDDLAKGAAFVMDMNTFDGVYVSVPADGTLVKVYRPVATGTPVNRGTVEIVAAPVVQNKKKLLKIALTDVDPESV